MTQDYFFAKSFYELCVRVDGRPQITKNFLNNAADDAF